MNGTQAFALMQSIIDDTLKGAGALKGNDGKSAYDIACENGFSGTEKEWVNSLNPDINIKETVQTEVNAQIENQLQDTIKETVDKAIEDALYGSSGDSSSGTINSEIDSWF